MSRTSILFMWVLSSTPVSAGLLTGTELQAAAPEGPIPHGDLEAFYEFHIDPRERDFGSTKPRGETARPLGVECGVLTDSAPVAQWIARPPPKGQVAGSIPARGTNSPKLAVNDGK